MTAKRCTTHYYACDCREDQHARLLAFAREIMKAHPEGGIDGGDLQDIATKYGLLIANERDTPCDEDCYCAVKYGLNEFPLTCYQHADFLILPEHE